MPQEGIEAWPASRSSSQIVSTGAGQRQVLVTDASVSGVRRGCPAAIELLGDLPEQRDQQRTMAASAVVIFWTAPAVWPGETWPGPRRRRHSTRGLQQHAGRPRAPGLGTPRCGPMCGGSRRGGRQVEARRSDVGVPVAATGSLVRQRGRPPTRPAARSRPRCRPPPPCRSRRPRARRAPESTWSERLPRRGAC